MTRSRTSLHILGLALLAGTLPLRAASPPPDPAPFALDDGETDASYGGLGAAIREAAVQLPGLGGDGRAVEAIHVCWDPPGDLPASDPKIRYEVVLWNDAAGRPGSELARFPAVAIVPPYPLYHTTTFPPVDAPEGTWVGVRWNPGVDPGFRLCADHDGVPGPGSPDEVLLPPVTRAEETGDWLPVAEVFDDPALRALMIRASAAPAPEWQRLYVPEVRVEPGADGTTTLFAVRNMTPEIVDLWTRVVSAPSAEVVETATTLGSRATTTVNLRDRSELPRDEDGTARGFVEIWARGDSLGRPRIAGDRFQIDVGDGFATGDRLETTPCEHVSIRFLRLPVPGSGSRIRVVAPLVGATGTTAASIFTVQPFDEAGTADGPPQVWQAPAGGLDLDVATITDLPFGTLRFDFLGNRGMVIGEAFAEDRFSVSLAGSCEPSSAPLSGGWAWPNERTLRHDDGEPDAFYGGKSATTAEVATRFSDAVDPAAKLDAVQVCWRATGAHHRVRYEVVVWTDDDGRPGAEWARTAAVADGIGTTPNFVSTPVFPRPIPAQAWIGVRWNPIVDAGFELCGDHDGVAGGPGTVAATPGAIRLGEAGAWQSISESFEDPAYRALGIRAVVSEPDPTVWQQRMVLPSFRVEATDPAGTTTLLALRNLTFDEVEAWVEILAPDGEVQASFPWDLGPRQTRTLNLRDVPDLEVGADGFARGSVEVTASSGIERLVDGDALDVAPESASATSIPLAEAPRDVCKSVSVRVLRFPPDGSGTRVTVWTDRAGTGHDGRFTVQGFDEAGGSLGPPLEIVPPASAFELPVDPRYWPTFGHLLIRFLDNGQGVVSAETTAYGAYSVGLLSDCQP